MNENEFELALDELIDCAINSHASRQDVIAVLEAKLLDLREEIETIETTPGDPAVLPIIPAEPESNV